MTKIVKATSKGQITLPMEWRKKFDTDQFVLTCENDYVKIRPIELEKVLGLGGEKGWQTVFNADQDNNGKGIESGEFLKILKKIDG